MRHRISGALKNIRGGLTGVLVYLGISAALFFAAFMAALGNDTPSARFILALFEAYTIVAHPLWGLPLSYLLGGLFLFTGPQGGVGSCNG